MSRLRLRKLDFNVDAAVDQQDVAILEACGTGPSVPYDPANLPTGCDQQPDAWDYIAPDIDRDGDVDAVDFAMLQRDLELACD